MALDYLQSLERSMGAGHSQNQFAVEVLGSLSRLDFFGDIVCVFDVRICAARTPRFELSLQSLTAPERKQLDEAVWVLCLTLGLHMPALHAEVLAKLRVEVSAEACFLAATHVLREQL